MVQLVKIKTGTYRNQEINETVFPLVKRFQTGAKGGFITVDGTGVFGKDKIRVLVGSSDDFEFVDVNGNVTADIAVPVVVEQDDETRMAEIADRFETLDEMTRAAINSNIRAMIVSGPPGVGKSYGVERELESAPLFQMLNDKHFRYDFVKGSTTALGLYQMLYKYSDKGNVLVFDDCDNILYDDICLNLLKGALDSGKRRRISWLSESRVLADAGIPSTFDFKGTVIFITNLKFDSIRNGKMKDHLEALQSRCHYLDLTLDTMRDKLLRIKQIGRTGNLFSDFGFDEEVQDEIIAFMDTNQDRLREMSLRMAIKIGELRATFPHKWKAMSETTCMKNI